MVGSYPHILYPHTRATTLYETRSTLPPLFIPIWVLSLLPTYPVTHLPSMNKFLAVVQGVRNNALTGLNRYRHWQLRMEEQKAGNQIQGTKKPAGKLVPLR